MNDPLPRNPARIGLTTFAALLAAGATPAERAIAARPTVARNTAANATLPKRGEFAFRYDGILGTSMDMVVRDVSAPVAHAAVGAALGEIDRLSAILDRRDPSSQISRLISGGEGGRGSSEIGELLDVYRMWAHRTGGAISCQVQPLADLWRRAEARGAAPHDEEIASALAEVQKADGSLLTRHINVDALGKAFVIDRALAAAKRAAGGASGIMLDIGGDIAVSGSNWTLGVADPLSPADNASPLARVCLADQAVATSAEYERFFNIAGGRFSHLLDPRTGRPAPALGGSTVIASDATTANALALALSILGPTVGADLIDQHGAAALFVQDRGAMHRLGNFEQFEAGNQPISRRLADATPSAWPADHQVTISLTLKPHPGRRAHRPYVAVWVEDADRKPVRTIAVWGNDSKYQRELSRWWKIAPQDPAALAGVTRATRLPGKYILTWDGLSDAGKPLEPGKYTICVEINREHGTHGTATASVECGGDAAASAKGEATEEADEILIDYARKESR